MTEPAKVPCPFVYKSGKRCLGHIVSMAAFKADLEWVLTDDGNWRFSAFPRTHFHLYCSEKGNHAGMRRSDNEQMKLFGDKLPAELLRLIKSTI
jgi:hypothetical protein